MQGAEKKRERMNPLIDFPTSDVFSDVSASAATHSFRDYADRFLPYLSTSS